MKKRNGEIDVLRFVFSLVIVIHHYCYIYGFKILNRTSWGYIGVEFFFLVTGFLMAKKVSPPAIEAKSYSSLEIADETWKFLFKKIAVFFKYYVFSYFVQLVAKIIIFDWKFTTIIDALLRTIPNLTLSFVGVVANSNLYISGNWYLSAMVIALFILYPLLLKNYHLSTKIIFPLISIFLLGHMYHNYSQVVVSYTEYTFMSTGLIRAIIEIGMGASLFEVTKVIEKGSFNIVIMTVVKVLAYMVVFMYAYGYTDRTFDIHALLWCSIAVGLSFSEKSYKIPGNCVTHYLGKISLPIYIFHTIFMRCSVKILGNSIRIKTLVALIIVSVLFSVMLMYIVDWLCYCIGCIKKKRHALILQHNDF